MGTPILGHGREVPRWWPPFWGFSIQLGPQAILYLNTIRLTPSFWRKNRVVSIMFSSRYTRTLNWSIFFSKMYYLTDFKHFVSIYSLIFNPIDSIFYWFYIILTLHFPKNLDPNGSNLLSHAEPSYWKFGEVPPPPSRVIYGKVRPFIVIYAALKRREIKNTWRHLWDIILYHRLVYCVQFPAN